MDLCGENLHGSSYVLGVAPSFQLRGKSVELGSDNREIASYDGRQWKAWAGAFTRLDIAGPVDVYVHSKDGASSLRLGQFRHFSLADGCAHAEGRVLARFDEESA